MLAKGARANAKTAKVYNKIKWVWIVLLKIVLAHLASI
jgi:hypothetical protein